MLKRAIQWAKDFAKEQGLGWLTGMLGPLALGSAVYAWQVAVGPYGPTAFVVAFLAFVGGVVLWRSLGFHRTAKLKAATSSLLTMLRSRRARRAAFVAMLAIASGAVYLAAMSFSELLRVTTELSASQLELINLRADLSRLEREVGFQQERTNVLQAENRGLRQPVVVASNPVPQTVVVQPPQEPPPYIGWGDNDSVGRNEAEHILIVRAPFRNYAKTRVTAEITSSVFVNGSRVGRATRKVTFGPDQQLILTHESAPLAVPVDEALWATSTDKKPNVEAYIEVSVSIIGSAVPVDAYQLKARIDTKTKRLDLGQ